MDKYPPRNTMIMTDAADAAGESVGQQRLDELAEKHGLSIEEVRALVETADTECWECGRGPDEVTPIETYPVGDAETARLCHDCYGEYIEHTTTLSSLQAAVWALHQAGLEPAAIDKKLEKSAGQSKTAIRRARQKAREASHEIEQLEQTKELIGGEDDAE